ncbi:MAG: T9SS type A sorting domain-containing protein [FCB group bacterium]|nr:T9SS type A sorting domain-containing protein [FCB group bacterium]
MGKFIITGLIGFHLLVAGTWEYPGDVTLLGSEETVFSWTADSCEWDNTPDAPPRVFRDADNQINMTIGHYITYRLVGPDFNSLALDCSGPIHTSDLDNSDPALHNDYEWLSSTYTEDGITVHGLVHNEYHGFSSDVCPNPDDCAYTSITYAVSTDSGRSFNHATAPNHLVVAVDTATAGQRYGVIEPTNIIKHDGYYYFIAEAWGSTVERYPYIFRTSDLSDPTSWKGWDGAGFNVVLGNPYTDYVDYSAMLPLSKYTPWEGNIAYMHGSLTYNTYFDKFMLIGTTAKGNDWGIYYSLSDDLIHWTTRILVKSFTNESVGQGDPTIDPSRNHIYYATVIDHGDTSRNFEYSGQTAYLYYVRRIAQNTAGSNYPFERQLVRQEIQFSKRLVDGFTVTRRGDYEDDYQGDGICNTSAGHCSFRAALLESRYRPPYYADSLLTINFGIDIANHTITPSSGPFLGPTFPVNIDATTQDTYSPNTQSFSQGMNTQWGVEITGDNGYLNLEGEDSAVKGLKLTGLTLAANRIQVTGSSVDYIRIDSTSHHQIGGPTDADRNRIGYVVISGPADSTILENNYIGTDMAGVASAGFANSAVNVRLGATHTIIDGNLLSGSGFSGVEVTDTETIGTQITNNFIGVDRSGTAALPNSGSGIKINLGARETTISGNLIGGNSGEAGIYIDNNSGVTIQGNRIGINDTGDAVGNSGDGIWISGTSTGNLVGGENPGEGNTIAYNGGAGVSFLVLTTDGNPVLGNSIFSNGGEGIGNYSHLSVPVPTLQSGLINASGDSVRIIGSFSDSANAQYRIELFRNDSCDSGGSGEGQTYLGYTDVLTDSAGNGVIAVQLPGSFANGDILTATLTTPAQSTSAFSACQIATTTDQAPVISVSSDSLIFDFPYSAVPLETQNMLIYNSGASVLDWSSTTGAEWFWLEPNYGTVNPGDSAIVGVSVDGQTLDPGTYTGQTILHSNAVNQPDYPVTIQMIYRGDPGAPDLTIVPDTFNLSYLPSSVDVLYSESIAVTNNGPDDLAWTINSNQSWLYGLTPSSGSLSNGQTETIGFTIKVNQGLPLGLHTAYVVLSAWYGNSQPQPFEIVVNVTITNEVENLPPVADDQVLMTEPATDLSIVLTGSDPNNDPLSFAILQNPGGGALIGSPPNLTYRPDSGAVGTDSLLFSVSDGVLADTGTVTIHVLPAPGITFNGQVVFTNPNGPEMCGTGALAYLNIVDTGCGELTLGNAVAENTELLNDLQNLTMTMNNFSMEVDSFACIGDPWGDHRVYSGGTVTIEQDGNTLLSVGNVVMTSDQNYGLGTMRGSAVGEINAALSDPAAVAEFDPSGTGNLIAWFSGYNPVVQGACGFYDFSLTIGPYPVLHENLPPQAQDLDVSLDENDSLQIQLVANDPDEDSLTWSMIELPLHGALTGNLPIVEYHPDNQFFGMDSFFFAVSDGELSDTGRVRIIIRPVNDAPEAPILLTPEDGFRLVLNEDHFGDTLRFRWTSAYDADGDTISYTLEFSPELAFLNDWMTYPSAMDTVAYLIYQLPVGGIDTVSGTWDVTAWDTALSASSSNGPFDLTVDGTQLRVIENSSIPTDYRLYPAYPNPFNPATTLRYDIPEEAEIRIHIYDITGRTILRIDSGKQPAGSYRIRWNGRDVRGNQVSDGMYLVRFTAGNFSQTQKIVLLK